MLTLYHAPRSRSSLILWLLEELGEPYTIQIVPIVYGDGHGAPAPESYRAIHPHKKVPAIVHDGTAVFECAGIAAYIADTFPQAGLAPPIGDPRRGLYATLLAYWPGVLNPVASAHMHGWDKDAPTGFGDYAEVLDFLTRTTQNASPWLLGEQFTAVDVLWSAALDFYTGMSLLPKSAAFTDYMARANARPAKQRAMAKDNG
ncbi:MAG TPA: glutathione S-transferase [Rhizomicrobium sp.]|jgi:glutathione S-transferase